LVCYVQSAPAGIQEVKGIADEVQQNEHTFLLLLFVKVFISTHKSIAKIQFVGVLLRTG